MLGVTTQCAQCHTHKFDPLTHTEYYGLFAFFNNSYEAQSWIYTPEQQRQIADTRAKIADAEKRLQAARPEWQKELAAWSEKVAAEQPAWEPLVATLLETISGLNHNLIKNLTSRGKRLAEDCVAIGHAVGNF